MDSGVKSRQFRSKPPSSILRDQHRQSEWHNNKTKNNTINDNASGDLDMYYTTRVSNTTQSQLFNMNHSMQDSGIEVHNGLSSTLLETSAPGQCMPPNMKHNVSTNDFTVACRGDICKESETQTCPESIMTVNISQQTMAPHTSAGACQTDPRCKQKNTIS